MKKTLTILSLVILALLASCADEPVNIGERTSVEIKTGDGVKTRTILPTAPDISTYTVTLDGESEDYTNTFAKDVPITFDNVLVGAYTVKVEAKDSDEVTVATGSVEANITASGSNSITVPLEYLTEGTGRMEVEITWDGRTNGQGPFDEAVKGESLGFQAKNNETGEAYGNLIWADEDDLANKKLTYVAEGLAPSTGTTIYFDIYTKVDGKDQVIARTFYTVVQVISNLTSRPDSNETDNFKITDESIIQYLKNVIKSTVTSQINAEDPKKIVIEELPYGVTTEKMIQSIENANKNGQLKIAQINDFTSNKASIEIAWQRNTYSKDMIDVLYATTDCEIKISVNPLVIKGGLPHIVPISEQVRYHAHHLIDVLEKELRYQRGEEEEKLKARTLERIFIEERVYKKIENVKTSEGVKNAIIKGMDPFIKETSYHPLSDDDIERLLKIPIRRISLFDIEKNRKEIEEINARIGQIDYNLTHIVEYAIDTLDDIEASADQSLRKRNTEISAFESLSAKEVAVRNLDLRYDKETGYIGTSLKTGEVLLKVSTFDKFFYMKANGEYRVTNVSDKEFIGTEGLLYFNYGEKDVISKEVFTVIYTEKSEEKGRSLCYIKRFQIPSFTLGKLYSILKRPKAKIRKLYLFDNAMITLKYKKGFGYRQLEEVRYFADFRVQKNANGQGLLLTAKEVEKFNIREMKKNTDSSSAEPDLFKE